MITGAPKTGKSLLSVYFVKQFYKKALYGFIIKCILNKLTFGLLDAPKEMPLIYSNIPLKIKLFGVNNIGYVPITREMITRQERINEKSVCYLGEYSLVANSKLGMNNGIKNGIDYDLINEELLLWTKLCGHQFNGRVIIDSQSCSDVHYSIKRVLSQYVYIHHTRKLLFNNVVYVRECMYSDDNSVTNTNTGDVEDNLKWLLVPKYLYKAYDFRCYSILTDKLVSKSKIKFADAKYLKTNKIVSYSDFKTIKVNKEIK